MFKILFANGRPTPPISLGGDSVCINILLQNLQKAGHICYTFGVLNPEYSYNYNIHSTSNIRKILEHLGINYIFKKNWTNISMCRRRGSFYFAVKRSIEYMYPFRSKMVRAEFFVNELAVFIQHTPPDIIITQIDNVPEVIEIAKNSNIPVIIIIQDLELYNLRNIEIANSYKMASIVFISNAVRDKFGHHCKIPSYVWYHPLSTLPLIDKISKNAYHKKYITMINPIFVKGGNIFLNIVKQLPKLKFMAVLNWCDPIKDSIDLSKYENIHVTPRSNNMDVIYKQTKLILVPSVWDEAFGRVVIESASYGIPTIASNSGGLKESVGEGGILINNFINTDEWVKAIEKLLNKKNYTKYSKLALKNSLKFAPETQCRKFENIIKKSVADRVN